MLRNLARRLSRIEAALTPPPPTPPWRLEIKMHETREQALERHVRQYGPDAPRYIRAIMPAKPETPEERAELERRFKIDQIALIAAAKSERATRKI